jgi:hypothetical protein
MTPVFRVSINQGSNSAYGRYTYRSAPVSYGWLSPNLVLANQIFADMTGDINENRSNLARAASDVTAKLEDSY